MEWAVIVIGLLTAVAALLTALAAWDAAKAAKRTAEVAERAALLATIPLIVPWFTKDASLKIMNRGQGTAHEMEWKLEAEGRDPIQNSVKKVIRRRRPRVLLEPQNATVSALLRSGEAVISCTYLTSWGERFTLERTYKDGDSQGIRLIDAEGKRIAISDQSEG